MDNSTDAPKKQSGLAKPMNLTPELEEVVGKGPMSRAEVTKNLWKYIKENNLQDPNDKRTIVADEKLKAVFGGQERVGMFEMTKLISKHLS
jgi:chromatin remodeling complex protein RSC6